MLKTGQAWNYLFSSSPMDRLSLVLTTFASKISIDVSGNFGREFSLVGSHVVIKRRVLSSLEVFQPCSKQAKHGTTCLVLPSKPFVMDLTVHVDISSNPGPESNQEITLRSVGLYRHHLSQSPQLITYLRNKLLSLRRFSPARVPFQPVSVLKDSACFEQEDVDSNVEQVYGRSHERGQGA